MVSSCVHVPIFYEVRCVIIVKLFHNLLLKSYRHSKIRIRQPTFSIRAILAVILVNHFYEKSSGLNPSRLLTVQVLLPSKTCTRNSNYRVQIEVTKKFISFATTRVTNSDSSSREALVLVVTFCFTNQSFLHEMHECKAFPTEK